MDILIPIGIGFIANFMIFIIFKSLKQSNERSLLICVVAFLAVFLSSFVIGSWLGMGIGVSSLGMLLSVILIRIILAFVRRKGYV
ncbi:hypothetical protein [Bacillus piscicola]|uniref:hypothetical protein n=1 Tax=Bacillus piscicola TaxID=1632684 RepID=UPI001F088D76|nr:hypothetical protein [Bacillus piscicola]